MYFCITLARTRSGKSYLIFGTLRLFMITTNLFVVANGKQSRTGGSFRILLSFFPDTLGCWCPKFSNFYIFLKLLWFDSILEGLRNLGGWWKLNSPNPLSVRHWLRTQSRVSPKVGLLPLPSGPSLFHHNNGCMNCPDCYATRTLPVLLNIYYTIKKWELRNLLQI